MVPGTWTVPIVAGVSVCGRELRDRDTNSKYSSTTGRFGHRAVLVEPKATAVATKRRPLAVVTKESKRSGSVMFSLLLGMLFELMNMRWSCDTPVPKSCRC